VQSIIFDCCPHGKRHLADVQLGGHLIYERMQCDEKKLTLMSMVRGLTV
jgi:hypothetical protein